jgi:hypothetical protein
MDGARFTSSIGSPHIGEHNEAIMQEIAGLQDPVGFTRIN